MHFPRRSALRLAAAVTLACGARSTYAQLAAFPGAQGFGEFTTGGRSGSVYVVTNLNDSGAGSFRDACSQSNRIIVFAVGGYINLSSAISASSNLTILGQTAPGQGIGIAGHELSFSDKSNVIIQYLRVREGSSDSSAKPSLNLGDLNGGIVDHVSAEFSQYDNIDAVGANSAANNITFQNDLVADAIKTQQLNLHEEGNQTTYLNNIFANAHGRAPLAKSNDQYVNNVVYNYGYAYTTGNSSGHFKYDILNNYFIAGPSTTSPGDAWYQLDSNQSAFSSGNLLDSNKNGTLDGVPTAPGGLVALNSEWSTKTQFLPTLSTTDAYTFDVAHAGDSLQYDQVDQQIIAQVKSLGTQGSILNGQNDDGLANNGFGTITGGTAPTDSDGDGIPDAWEITHGLNPNVPDSTLHNALGYTMIEQYAYELADEYATQTWTSPTGEWTGGPWSASTPGIYDHALISGGGKATISTGDNANAFNLYIAGGQADTGKETLAVTGGSLTVQDTIYVGNQAAGEFDLSAGVVRANNLQLGNTVWDSGGNPTSFPGVFAFTGGTLQVIQIVRGAGSPGNWNSGAIWTWAGGTVQAFGNLNISAPATLGPGGALVNTVGPDGTVYNGTISAPLSGIGGFTKLGAGSLTLSASNSYGGPTTVTGGVLQITGSIAKNSSPNVFIAPDSTGNTLLARSTPFQISYTGFGSTVTGGLQSAADLVQGMNATNNPNGKSLTMSWRLRTPAETPAGADSPGLISEVFSLTGMANSGSTGVGQTDPFALQLTFSPTYFTDSSAESAAAAAGGIQPSGLSGNAWQIATAGDFGAGSNVFTNVQNSWQLFAAANGITDANVGNFLGSWGVDVPDNQAWAVVNHNSTYAVDSVSLPEPAAGLLLAGAASLLRRTRRRAVSRRRIRDLKFEI